MTALTIVILCVAVFRVTRLFMLDEITKPIRDRLDRLVAEGHDAQNKMRSPKRRSYIAAFLVEMNDCPWCASWWWGLGAALAWWAAAEVPDPVLWVPTVALAASAFTGVASLVVGWLERLADPDD